jgi:general secretion pathway protein D
MRTILREPRRLTAAALLPLLLLAGACSFGEYRKAEIAEQAGNWDQAVVEYLELVQRHPEDLSYRSALLRVKMKASEAHFEAGKKLAEAGVLDRAIFEYRQAVELDPSNQYAAAEMNKARAALSSREHQQGEIKTIDEMKKDAAARSQPPMLEPRSNTPISLEFPNPVSIKDIYKALGKAFGINILFDPGLKDQEIAIELKDVTAQDALEILMRAANHFYKTLDPHTILVAADTPQNRRAYEDLVIQTFYLSNADVKDVMTMLRTLVDAKKIAANERLNAIIVRDSIDRVKVAEKLIETNDKARSEVVVDVELVQIDSHKLRDLGTALSSYSVSQSLNPGLDVDPKTEGVQIGLNDLQFLNRGSWVLTLPTFLYSFIKSNTDAQVLARPQLRISEGEKAQLHIGDRVPIPTTTFNTANTVGGNIVPITSFQYQDIGIKINIEPRVHHNLEVTLKVHVEISNLAGSVQGSEGSQPIIANRSIDTVIRLKDGETNFLAGLLRTDEQTTNQGIPGLSDIPILGRLLSHDTRDAQRTDVILTMTPHIIRRSDITEADLMPIWVGTEQNITFRGGSPRVESDVEGPFDEGSSAADRVRELIRQRVQELPPGLDEEPGAETVEPPASDEEQQNKQPQVPPGQDLNPPAFPGQQPQPQSQPTPPPPGQASATGAAVAPPRAGRSLSGDSTAAAGATVASATLTTAPHATQSAAPS